MQAVRGWSRVHAGSPQALTARPQRPLRPRILARTTLCSANTGGLRIVFVRQVGAVQLGGAGQRAGVRAEQGQALCSGPGAALPCGRPYYRRRRCVTAPARPPAAARRWRHGPRSAGWRTCWRRCPRRWPRGEGGAAGAPPCARASRHPPSLQDAARQPWRTPPHQRPQSRSCRAGRMVFLTCCRCAACLPARAQRPPGDDRGAAVRRL